MPLTLTLFAYTPEALAELARNPQDRSAAVSELAKGMGARVIAFYHSSGEYHGAIIAEVPDEVTATAMSIAAQAAGHLKTYETIPLLGVEEGLEALRRAGEAAFRGPGRRPAAESTQGSSSAEPPPVAGPADAISPPEGVAPTRAEEAPPREGEDRGLVDEALDALLGEKQETTRREPSRDPRGDEPPR